MSKLNFAILGLGNIAHKVADAINYLDDANLYAVVSETNSNREDFAKEYNCSVVYNKYIDAFSDENIDVIYITTINSTHYELIVDALKNNKHVICEKPASLSAMEIQNILELAKEKNLFFLEAVKTLFLPSVDFVKSNLHQIGKINTITSNFGFVGDNERLFNKSLGGGAIYDVAIYSLALNSYLLNDKMNYFYSNNTVEKDVDVKAHTLQLFGDIPTTFYSSVVEKTNKEYIIWGELGYIKLHNFSSCQELEIVIDGYKKIYSFPFELNGFEYEIQDAISSIKNNKIESDIYPHSNIKLNNIALHMYVEDNKNF